MTCDGLGVFEVEAENVGTREGEVDAVSSGVGVNSKVRVGVATKDLELVGASDNDGVTSTLHVRDFVRGGDIVAECVTDDVKILVFETEGV